MRIRRTLFALDVLVTFITLTPLARGFSYPEICGNWHNQWNGVGWFSSNFVTTNTFSFPAGSLQAGALTNAITQWNKYSFAVSNFGSRYNTGSVVLGDGISEAFLATQATLGTNVNGSTFPKYNGCNLWTNWTDWITEMDVGVLNTLNFSQGDESGWLNGTDGLGTYALLHEFGHGQGLGHDSSHFNIMNPSAPPEPFVGGHTQYGNLSDYTSQVLPDDALGLLNLYGSHPGEQPNLQASAQMFSGGYFVNTAQPTTTRVSRGRNAYFNMSWTVTNPGPTNITFDQAFYLTQDPANYWTNSVQIATWNGGTVNAHSVVTWGPQTFTVPSLMPPGTYWVVHVVNNHNGVWDGPAESTIFDNWVHNVHTVQVN